ncbi:MAG TPA: AMP-binding protein [Rhodocyclaceae bacterium]|nr:AMP-binding protein [Rhodocyclaceae bacterium]
MTLPVPNILRLLADGRADDHPVAHDGCRPILWKEFRDRIEARRTGSTTERRRILLADPSPIDFLAGLLAALADGHVPVIPPNFQPETLAAFASMPASVALPPHTLELYTSGSTGEPKCIRKSLGQLEAECGVLESCWGEAAGGATVTATTPHHHIYGLLFRLLWPLTAGRPIDNATIGEPSSLSERLTALGDAVLVSSPAQLARWPQLTDLAAMAHRPRLVFSSGGPLPAEAACHYAETWGDAPIEVFGSTETGGIAWRRQSGGNSAWTPLPRVQLAPDADGALLVRSPFLPDDSPLRMEDAVEFAPDGSFILRGRLDRIVKIEEKRLSLPEMESWLDRHPAVATAAVVPVPMGRRTMVGAVVVLQPGLPEDRRSLVTTLKDHLGQRYDDVLLPRRWRFVERLPYSERGKLAVDDLVNLLSTPL